MHALRTALRVLLMGAALGVLSLAQAAPPDAAVLERALALAADGRGGLALDPWRGGLALSNSRPLPLVAALLNHPLQAAYRVGTLEQQFRAQADSALGLLTLAGALAGAEVAREAGGEGARQMEQTLLVAADPLRFGLERLQAGSGLPWAALPALPDEARMPRALRLELGRLLVAIGTANRFRLRAFAELPASLSAEVLLQQVVEGRGALFAEPDLRVLLPRVELAALMAGMQELVAALEAFEDFIATATPLPQIDWQLSTPLGMVVIDTTGSSRQRSLAAPLLLVDAGGDDRYEFLERSPGQRISVLLDVGGDDHYVAASPAADPSAALLGYGLLWDSRGNDEYRAGTLAQAAAVFGAALLVDAGGRDHWQAQSHAQAFALGGVAVLLSAAGDDRYEALTHAQAAAAPAGVAILLDAAGNDRYLLANSPLLQPSAQSPQHNASMGQGAGRGFRADRSDGRSLAGGIGALFDLSGDDEYHAQVFAQAVGYWQGAGLLVDGSGDDRFAAAWYGQAAAAHDAVGVLIDRGAGADHYRATHSTSIAAAHDGSLAVLVDEGGDDHYALGNLGLGGANDNSVAIFVDQAGADDYAVASPECSAFGAARMSAWGTRGEDQPNLALFFDLGGEDAYPDGCARAGNQAAWCWPQQHPELQLRSEAGAGLDEQGGAPFATRFLTAPPAAESSDRGATLAAARAWRSDPRYAAGPRPQ